MIMTKITSILWGALKKGYTVASYMCFSEAAKRKDIEVESS